ncbi:unnamed protein product, partial [Didymodactylos carnosus]
IEEEEGEQALINSFGYEVDAESWRRRNEIRRREKNEWEDEVQSIQQ